MTTIKEAASEFPAHSRIAVTGVSRQALDGGCPSMFEPTADAAHKLMRLVFTVNHHVPRTV